MLNQSQITHYLKADLFELGFDFVGIAKADFLAEEAPRLENWLANNHHGEMAYMANYFDKRLDPRLLVPGAKSVISVLYNYYNPAKQVEDSPKISSYAYGEDYHHVIKNKLKNVLADWSLRFGKIEGRIFVDSAPVMDKVWATKSGLGWIGKHTNLINKQQGSYFFIAEIMVDIVLDYDTPIKDYCGTCTKCIDACPTGAIIQPYVVDGSRCISYFTIELKDGIPQEMKGTFNNWMFGCDICQEVCPWNRFAVLHNEPLFSPNPALLNMKVNDWENLKLEKFNELFRNSAVKRTKYEGLMRNIRFLGMGTS
jgi:epoxyqueuosine reductase